MQDLFSSAKLYYSPVSNQQTQDREQLVKELETILDNSGFLSSGEKEKMKKVIPLFGESIIRDLKQTLIRQNLRHLQRKINNS